MRKAPPATPGQDVVILIQRAITHIQRHETSAAVSLLNYLLRLHPDQPMALAMLGFLHYRERRLDDAAALLTRSLALQPDQLDAQMTLGYVLSRQRKWAAAVAAFRAVVKLRPDLPQAHSLLARLLHDTGRLDEAEECYRVLIALAPSLIEAKLGLSAVLIDARRPAEAEAISRSALSQTVDPQIAADLEQNLGIALGLQYRFEEAITAYSRARAANTALTHLDHRCACLLQEVGKFDDAIMLFERILSREPANLAVHRDYNDLLYRLKRGDEFLRSYDRAVQHAAAATPLLLAKATFLISADRPEEAHETFLRVLRAEPDNREADAGSAVALTRMGRYDTALGILERLIGQTPAEVTYYGDAAAVLAQMREPLKAAAMAKRGLELDPCNQSCLALLGTAYRMMDDAREDYHNGYYSLIRVYDLEPPEGYGDMAAFNADLGEYLNRVHPPLREFVQQSLRGGTQTTNNIFGAGHELVERLRSRIDEAVWRYIQSMPVGEDHPFTRRKSPGFLYSGSWSSRLRDNGYHVNHLHTGWISSCYYVAVPAEASDATGKRGWLKFGEPCYDVGLSKPVARAIQPAIGRLVLFPSYTWHGTIPFHSVSARTTIAFDVIPA